MAVIEVPGNVGQVRTGVGPIYMGLSTTTLPTEWNSVLDVGLIQVGLTVESQDLEISTSVDGVEVNERLRPIRYEVTGSEGKFTFTAAQFNPRMMQIALGGGTVTNTGTSIMYTFPDISSLQRFVCVQRTTDGRETLVLPLVSSAGSLKWSRSKGTDVAGIPIELNIEEAVNDVQPYYLWDPSLLDEGDGDYGIVTP